VSPKVGPRGQSHSPTVGISDKVHVQREDPTLPEDRTSDPTLPEDRASGRTLPEDRTSDPTLPEDRTSDRTLPSPRCMPLFAPSSHLRTARWRCHAIGTRGALSPAARSPTQAAALPRSPSASRAHTHTHPLTTSLDSCKCDSAHHRGCCMLPRRRLARTESAPRSRRDRAELTKLRGFFTLARPSSTSSYASCGRRRRG